MSRWKEITLSLLMLAATATARKIEPCASVIVGEHFGMDAASIEEALNPQVSYVETQRQIQWRADYQFWAELSQFVEAHPDRLQAMVDVARSLGVSDSTSRVDEIVQAQLAVDTSLSAIHQQILAHTLLTCLSPAEELTLKKFESEIEDRILTAMADLDARLPSILMERRRLAPRKEISIASAEDSIILAPDFESWMEEMRDSQVKSKVNEVLGRLREYGLKGIADKITLNRFNNIVEIRLHLKAGYRIYCGIERRTGRVIVAGAATKPREGSTDNYPDARRAMATIATYQ